MATTNKKSVARLLEICHLHGLYQVVFSPGSRNAPMVIAFTNDDRFSCISIPDERVAAFYAMGISQKTRIPTIICCTSGTASLNYAPAICEAYYQGIPMLILTADRPVEKIDQGIGQSMRQKNVYDNYTVGSFQFRQEATIAYDIRYNDSIVDQAIRLTINHEGPVHINVPLEEPLYGLDTDIDTSDINIQPVHRIRKEYILDDRSLEIWKSSVRKIFILGQGIPDDEFSRLLSQKVSNSEIILLTETCSNAYVDGSVQCIDRFLEGVKANEESYRPDLLIYMGGQIISKKIKKYFTDYSAKHQWYVSIEKAKDTFESLTYHHRIDKKSFLQSISRLESPNDPSFQSLWNNTNREIKLKHDQLIQSLPYSDMSIFSYLMKAIPEGAVLHLSNSTVVRYVQLFDQRKDLVYHANRGVSGIDGCTSTAMGYASVSDKENYLITGDLSFFYDSNAFLHHHLPPNLKIILINNHGGGIFRIIDGPSSSDRLDQFFEATHNWEAEKLAEFYNIHYSRAEDLESFDHAFQKVKESDASNIHLLEVITPRLQNSDVLKGYLVDLR